MERRRARRRLGGFFSLAPRLRGRDERSSLSEGWGEGLLLESGTPSPGATRRPLPASGARLKRTTDVFDNLSERLGGILDRLTRRGSLTEADVDAAMREVRRALLEADVSLDV